MKVYNCITAVGQFTILPVDAPDFIQKYNDDFMAPIIKVKMGRIRELNDGRKVWEEHASAKEGEEYYVSINQLIGITAVEVEDRLEVEGSNVIVSA